jgi:ParB family chromosome partitioning protein
MNQSEFQNIGVGSIAASKTNPRGAEFTGPAFEDLVASIKEKGIFVPVIVRPAGKGYEIVAGSRRLAAAKRLKLKEIPASIRELSDAEAQEVQIIENLQREDVHPLEEGQAYRKLVEESHYEVPSIAAKVGKSESYVRQRIFLTRLEPAVQTAYRAGNKVQDGHALLIAKLSPIDQISALKHINSYWRPIAVSELKSHIDAEFYHPLEHQPWLKDAAAMAAVGPCKECPPSVPSLFGAVKEGACTDKKCWRRKMERYISWKKEKNPDLVLISKQYHYTDKESTGKVLYSNQYEKIGPKNKCQHSVMGLVASGEGVGSQIRICVAPECKIHGKRHSATAVSPEDKAKREKEIATEKAKEEKRRQAEYQFIADGLKKIKWPMTKKTLDVLFELALNSDHDLEKVCDRRAIQSDKDGDRDEEKEIRKAAAKMSDGDKLALVVEVMLSRKRNY